ncbi:MAG: permease [Chloroflexota bacterium]|nr:permease [Chloroflexota bacterium]
MLPDLPVLALKLRDYFFWLLPAYVLALAVTTGWSAWIAWRDPQGYAQAGGDDPAVPQPSVPVNWLLWRVLGGRPAAAAGPRRIPATLWVQSLGRSVTPLALLATAALHPVLGILRLGLGLLLCAGVAAVIGRLALPESGRPGRPAPEQTSPAPALRGGERFFTVWRHHAGRFLDDTSTALLISAAGGGLITAWLPLRGIVGWVAAQGAWAVLPVALLTFALPFPAGTELPLARALQTYDLSLAAVLMLFLATPLLHWPLLRGLYTAYGRRVVALYVGSIVIGALGLSVLTSTLLGGGRNFF